MDNLNERKRARNACQRCRKRKQRCTSELQAPCSSCISAGARCLFVERSCPKMPQRRLRSPKVFSVGSEIPAKISPVQVQVAPLATSTVNDSQPPKTPPSSENTWNIPYGWTDGPGEDFPSFPSSFTPKIDNKSATLPGPATVTADQYRLVSWLMLCPIPLTDGLDKDLVDYMSNGELNSNELLSLLLRFTEFIRMRVTGAYSSLGSRDRQFSACNQDGPTFADRLLEESYEEKQIRQDEILAKCQNLLELCQNARRKTMNESSIPPGEAISITHHPRIASDMLFDKRIFDLKGSPLDRT